LSSTISVLVCDLGKVLLPLDTEPCWQAILPHCEGGEAARAAFHDVYAECQIGTGRTEAREFFSRIASRMGLRLDYEAFCRAWSDMFWEDEAVIDLVRAARVERRVLLSNTNAIHWEFIRARYPHVLASFDRLFVSHECGLEKPDPGIFRLVEQDSGRPPREHLFIDDIEENVAGARAVGWDAIHHTGADRLRVEFAARGLV
jgi:glucose-1-phosphatase